MPTDFKGARSLESLQAFGMRMTQSLMRKVTTAAELTNALRDLSVAYLVLHQDGAGIEPYRAVAEKFYTRIEFFESTSPEIRAHVGSDGHKGSLPALYVWLDSVRSGHFCHCISLTPQAHRN